jgi:hypothetical protein
LGYLLCYVEKYGTDDWEMVMNDFKVFSPTFHEKFGMFQAGWSLVQIYKILQLGVMRGGFKFISYVTSSAFGGNK